MHPEPSISQKLMLWHIVEASEDGLVLDPYDQLSEMPPGVLHALTQREDHPVRVEAVERVLPCEEGGDGLEPLAGEHAVLVVTLRMIIENRLVLCFALEEFAFPLHVIDAVGRIRADEGRSRFTDDLRDEGGVRAVPACDDVVSQPEDRADGHGGLLHDLRREALRPETASKRRIH